MFRRSPRQRANQASARVPTRHAGVRAPQWIQYFVRASQKLSDIGLTIGAQVNNLPAKTAELLSTRYLAGFCTKR